MAPTANTLSIGPSFTSAGSPTPSISSMQFPVKTHARIVEGDPGKVICKEAERIKPVAVVLGSRGRSLIRSVLQGGVSEHCFHNIQSAPVIIVPRKEAGEESLN